MKKIYSLIDSLQFAEKLANVLEPGDTVLFAGDLGTGKSTIIRKLIQTLTGENIDVPSPTFTLAQTYDSPRGQLWHFDLYRLESPEEVAELGIEEAFHEGISFIEWPDRLGNLKPDEVLTIHLKMTGESDKRIITVSTTQGWEEKLNNLV